MASYEDSYKSQLQGVSQQIARERLDGQVSAQDNMLSDTVTNLRRRPGAAFAYSIAVAGATEDTILAWDTDLGGEQVQVILNTSNGVLRVLNSAYTVLATTAASAYLTTADVNDIQVATVGDEFFLVNTKKVPAAGASVGGIDPKDRGFFYVKTGAFSKAYEVRVQCSAGGFTALYTTPNGTAAGDAALSTPEYIAGQLHAQITGAFGGSLGITRDNSFVYLQSANLACTTPSGANYVVASGSSYIRQEADLPSRLPSGADGYIVSTGELKALRYYKYAHSKLAWLESGSFSSPITIPTAMPISLTKIGAVWTVLSTAFEGRFAGDSDTNPDPAFLTRGITGMSSYQGRLVLLAGSMVCMSASSKPRRFYRSTVTTIIDSDCIEVGASAASSAAYKYAVQFQKDLLLFSSKYQAVVPGGNTAITPRTAAVVVTSTYDSDMTSKPTPVGRTLMYSASRSKDFFGMMEMLPSQQTDAMYTSFDSTAHIPKYMAGRCRFGVSSSVANMVLFSPTTDRYSLIIHEYTWQEDKKVQQAWHKWTFKYKVAAAYFSGQAVHILFVKNGYLVACTIDPRAGLLTAGAQAKPFLDMSVFATVTARTVAYPAWISLFDSTALPDLKLSVSTGPLAGEEVGFTTDGTVMTTVLSFPTGEVAIGFPYVSTFSPTAPMVKDANGVKISSNKMTVLRFAVGTNNSAQYQVAVSDNAMAADPDAVGVLYFSSSELVLGEARTGGDSVAIVPCRTAADSTSLIISTGGVGELNMVSLEYVARYHEKIKRATKVA
jgi:hypothetical protein